MTYETKTITDYILSKASEFGITDLMPMKLQKLVYFAHGWHLAVCDSEPLTSEEVEAWRFGPVFPSLYRAYKAYGNHPIMDCGDEKAVKKIEADIKTKTVLDAVLEKYGKYTAIQLSNMTHKAGTPWAQTWDGSFCKTIPNEIIEDYFINLEADFERANCLVQWNILEFLWQIWL